jgi:hypothetical protein
MTERLILLALMLLVGRVAEAQNESRLRAEFRREGERFSQRCLGEPNLIACGQVLFADHPLHAAVGSIAPQNGVSFGPAFAYSTFPGTWRLRWNADTVFSTNGSSRAGLYLTAFPVPTTATTRAQPVVRAYAQTVSLEKLTYFGLGHSTSEADRSFFGMRQTVTGMSALIPVSERARFGVYGEIQGRFVDIRPRPGEGSPSIEALYNDATAPGLDSQPAFLQVGGGVRLTPTFRGNFVRLDYEVLFQQFSAFGNSDSSFRRLRIDLGHEFVIYRTTRSSVAAATVGPDGNPDADVPVSVSGNREGAFGLRFLVVESFTRAGNRVPFYFQPTLGGSDINGEQLLPGLQDYRFRAPNLLAVRGSFEHSIWGPLGMMATVEAGRVAMDRFRLDEGPFRRAYAAGLTLRAGNIPQIVLLVGWGSGEATHTIAHMNTALLGASSRPSLD